MSEAFLNRRLRNKSVRIFPVWLVFVLKAPLRTNEDKKRKGKRHDLPLLYSQSMTAPVAERKALFPSAQIKIALGCECVSLLTPASPGSFLSEKAKGASFSPSTKQRKK